MLFSTFQALSSLAIIAKAHAEDLHIRQDCSESYTLCQPAGATKTSLPEVGSDLARLYVDLLDTVKAANIQSRHAIFLNLLDARDSPGVCCVDGTACLNAQDFLVPFCYDHFTTNFFLPDGTYGSLDSGAYHAADGSTANLTDGSYIAKDGQSGNIYGSSGAPNSATRLPIPTPYTAAGVGSAIPVTALGGIITYTTTVAGTTIVPTTVPASTISIVIVVGTSTVATASTEVAKIITGTTIPPTIIVVTTIGAQATSTGAAGSVTPLPHMISIGGIGVAALAVLDIVHMVV